MKLLYLSLLILAGCGIPGPKGDPGEPGTSGSGIFVGSGASLQQTTVCLHTVDSIEHVIYVFSDGSVATTCSITFAASGQASTFRMYEPRYPGAKNALCSLNGTGGRFDLFTWDGGLISTHTQYLDSTVVATETIGCQVP